MSKRGNEGPQGDKDSLNEFLMSSTPEEKPQRATAAQMANRKIKDVRRRRPNTAASGSPAPQQSFGSPFGSLDANANPPAPTNGFSFGQSQSFPGAAPATSQPATNGTSSPFSFGNGGGTSSFNFNAGPSTTTSNPFATMNTSAPSQPASGGGFGGFQGSIFNLASTGTQSPAQQSLPSGGLFGATTSGPSAGATPATSGGSLFGQASTLSPAPTPAASTNIFGQFTSEKPSLFGQSTGFGDDSMQTSPDAKSSTASKPSIFGNGTTPAPPPTFGGFGGSNIFSQPETSAPSPSPTKPLFGAKPDEKSTPASPFTFGAKPAEQTAAPASPSLFGATTQTSSATTTSTTAPSLFGASTSTPNPFQSSNLFSGAPSSDVSKAATEKPQEEKKPSDSTPKSPFQFTPSASTGPSLFSKSETAAPSGGLFGQASQPPSTGSLFAPKPPAATSQKAPEGNPFGGLFGAKPAAQPTPESKPEENKQQPTAQNPFGGLFSPKPSEPEKPAAPAPSFSASTPAAGAAKPPSVFQPSTSMFQPPASTPAAAPKSNALEPTPQRLETMQPKGLSIDLNKHLKGDVELLNRVRILNESFKREIAKLDPSKDDFDLVILCYMRVRDTIGAPTGGERAPKRKTREEESAAGDKDVPAQKKVKPFSEAPSSPAPQMNIAPSSITSTPSKLFGTSEIAKSSKRKSDDEHGGVSETPSAKRSQGDSATASIFAQTFSNSKSSESGKEEASKSPVSSPFKPTTPESKKVAPASTTPTTSPAKTLFPTPAGSKEVSAPFGQPSPTCMSASKVPKSAAAPANPFMPKPTENKSGETTAAPTFSIPKFGAGSGTNFFAQFKTQVDKQVEKEKAKRKEEDFDSEEEDEAEWERKDAERQRKKREELEAQSQKRAKFIPGQGFSFEEDDSTNTQDSKNTEDSAVTNGVSFASSTTSVFDTKSETSEKPSNIFSHLSATPTEVEENDGDDTEEASDNEDEGQEPKAAVVSKEDASSEDGDFGKALKKSKTADKPVTGAESTGESTPATPAGGNLFGRVQDKEGDAKSGEETPKNPFASLFSTPKPAASSGTAAPSIFAPTTSTSGSTSIFGASMNATGGGLFGASTPAAGTSLFGASQSGIKPANDHTWKKDSPIKFASDSKPDSEKPSEAPKPFSTLFGAPPAAKPSTPGDSKPMLGFTFGAPASQTSSIFSSATTPATTSAASTSGTTSETGAGESGDGDAAEALPQVDLARSRAGEENEDLLMETRARGLKMAKGGWDSQGVGFVRILKNRETSRSRVLLRADPSGNVILNASLMKDIKYTVNGTGVFFAVPQPDGSLEQWAIRTKKEDIGRLASTMEEAKA